MRLSLVLLSLLLSASAARAQVDPQVLEAEAARVAVVERASQRHGRHLCQRRPRRRLGRGHLARRLRAEQLPRHARVPAPA